MESLSLCWLHIPCPILMPSYTGDLGENVTCVALDTESLQMSSHTALRSFSGSFLSSFSKESYGATRMVVFHPRSIQKAFISI